MYWLLSSLPLPSDPGFWIHHRSNLILLSGLSRLGMKTIDRVPIREWAVTHKPKEFYALIRDNQHQLSKFPAMGDIRSTQHFCDQLQKAIAKLNSR